MKKPKTLKTLQKEWYKKLEREGFKDIEKNPDTLKVYDKFQFITKLKSRQSRLPIGQGTQFPHRIEAFRLQAIQEYYYRANQFLNDHKFANKRERIVWEYHANGISYRDISKTLRKVRISIARTQVYDIVKRLRRIMFAMYGIK